MGAQISKCRGIFKPKFISMQLQLQFRIQLLACQFGLIMRCVKLLKVPGRRKYFLLHMLPYLGSFILGRIRLFFISTG